MRRRLLWLAVGLAGFVLSVEGAFAHAGGIRSAAPEPLQLPIWLFLATGGGVVGASFLLASFVTDRSFVRLVDGWTGARLRPGRVTRLVGRAVGLIGLLLVFVAGVAGTADPVRNPATLVVWVGWWGGVTALAYLVVDPWPTLNPFATIGTLLPTLDRRYPARLGAWPAVLGLLALVYLEVVTPLSEDPTTLALVVAGYTLSTLLGVVVFGSDQWFARADPVARLLAAYGRIAPLARSDDGLRLRLPGGDGDPFVRDQSDAVFVIAVVFVTTYDGFVGTALFESVARPLVRGGILPPLVYLGVLGVGFSLFLAVFFLAVSAGRRLADTYVTPAATLAAFTPSLLAIAAGYHLAHNLGTTLTLLPALVVGIADPLGAGAPPTLAVPSWFGGVGVVSVLAGHLLAVWMAHTAAYDLFPDRTQAIRSQYGLTLVMIAYTMVSLWIVTTPGGAPPFV